MSPYRPVPSRIHLPMVRSLRCWLGWHTGKAHVVHGERGNPRRGSLPNSITRRTRSCTVFVKDIYRVIYQYQCCGREFVVLGGDCEPDVILAVFEQFDDPTQMNDKLYAISWS